jgi:molybdenum cofactor cytidylyltransferase
MIVVQDIVLIVLAAGLSRRHEEGDKLLRPLSHKPLAEYCADTLAAIPFMKRFVVVPSEKGSLARLFQKHDFRLVCNDSPERGLGYSLSLGVQEVLKTEQPEAIMICLADMPYITAEVISRLVDGLNSGASASVCSSDGHITPPAVFRKAHFCSMTRLDGDEGAKKLLGQIRDACEVEIAPQLLADFDTSHDFTFHSNDTF